MDSHRHGCLAVGWETGLRHPLFKVVVLVYSVLYANKHWLHWPLPLGISSYLADLLSLPLMLNLALAAHRLLIDRVGTLPVKWVVAWAVADPLDVLAYALGALGFHYWLNRPPAPS
jgi:hypothetical protein